MNDELRVELEGMFAADQAFRKEVWGLVQEHGPSSSQVKDAWKRGSAIDAKNVARLVEILEAHGWPGSTLVGETACKSAFLVLQHADLATQKRYLPLLREATAAGEIETTALPMLEDRVRMREGRDQLYGSQLVHGEDGKPALWPIEDEAHVDERRASVGLPPLAEYLARAGLGHLRKDDADG